MKRFRLLVIEDNPGDVGLLREALEAAGLEYDLTVLPDGEQALTYLRSDGCERVPVDGILLDLNLPRVDGLQILAATRESPWLAQVPLIVMTSSSSPRDRERVEAHRVSRIIIKPADLDSYLAVGVQIKAVLDGE